MNNLTAIAAATMAMGVSGIANAVKPDPPQELGPVGEVFCDSITSSGDVEYWADWLDGIGTGVEAQQYGGDLRVDLIISAECQGGDVEGAEVSLEIDLGEVECEASRCHAHFDVDVDALAAEACAEAELGLLEDAEFDAEADFSVKYLNPGEAGTGGHRGRRNHIVTTVGCEEIG